MRVSAEDSRFIKITLEAGETLVVEQEDDHKLSVQNVDNRIEICEEDS